MGKHKKTREQKIAAAERHIRHSPVQYSLTGFSPELKPIPSSVPPLPKHDMVYVTKDLQRTFFVSIVLMLIEIILLFSLQHRIINIPLASY